MEQMECMGLGSESRSAKVHWLIGDAINSSEQDLILVSGVYIYLLLGGSSQLATTPVISGLTLLSPFATRVISYNLLSGMNHQVGLSWTMDGCVG